MIDSFRGDHYFLSNFFVGDPIYFEGLWFPSVEHAYQAAKTLNPKVRVALTDNNMSPGAAKKAGRTVVLRLDWDHVKLGIMEDLVRQKFYQPEMSEKLLATTGHKLVEGNTWNDRFWGVCLGKGENHLGKILMKVRDELIGFRDRPHQWKGSWPGNFCLECGIDDPLEEVDFVDCPSKDCGPECSRCGGMGCVPDPTLVIPVCSKASS